MEAALCLFFTAARMQSKLQPLLEGFIAGLCSSEARKAEAAKEPEAAATPEEAMEEADLQQSSIGIHSSPPKRQSGFGIRCTRGGNAALPVTNSDNK